jgi:hypothetical protein
LLLILFEAIKKKNIIHNFHNCTVDSEGHDGSRDGHLAEGGVLHLHLRPVDHVRPCGGGGQAGRLRPATVQGRPEHGRVPQLFHSGMELSLQLLVHNWSILCKNEINF